LGLSKTFFVLPPILEKAGWLPLLQLGRKSPNQEAFGQLTDFCGARTEPTFGQYFDSTG